MPIGFFPTNPNVARSVAAYNATEADKQNAITAANAAIWQAEMQAKAQQEALRSQYFQNQQANALQQQQIQNENAYRTGLLGNQRAQTEAQMAWQKALQAANASEAQKDRESREKIATTTYGSRGQPSAVDIQDTNNQAQAMAGRLNFALKSLRESQAADEAKINSEFTTGMNSWSPFTFDSTYKKRKDDALTEIGNRYRQQINQLIQGVPQDSPIDFDGMQFVPKLIGAPTRSGTSTPAPAAPTAGVNPSSIVDEARDAIARGANPAAVQQRLQSLGLVLPPVASPGFFGGGTANVWPPMTNAPAMPPPAEVLTPAPSYFGQSFPNEFVVR